MDVELQINNSASPAARFLTWAPSPCRIRMTNPSGATGSTVNVRITSASAASAGAVVFRSGATGAFANSITVPVPVNGTSVPFLAAGRFGRPSASNGDVTIEARAGNTLVGSVAVMVRIRKNANTLTPAERDRFVAAFAQLNNQGLGRFADFRDMHTNVSSPQAHGAPGFLPWHRAYLLDLERELQAIDPSVALPYWRFDRAAPNLFQLDFLGVSDLLGTVRFSNSNPLQFWRDRRGAGDQPPAVLQHRDRHRRPAVRSADAGARHPVPRLPDHGGQPARLGAHQLRRFDLEHRQCCPRSAVLPAALQRRSAVGQVAAPERPVQCSAGGVLRPGPRTRSATTSPTRCGRGTASPGNPRPPTAPGGALAASPAAGAPGPQPTVRSTLDYQGAVSAAARMGFDYDDVAF